MVCWYSGSQSHPPKGACGDKTHQKHRTHYVDLRDNQVQLCVVEKGTESYTGVVHSILCAVCSCCVVAEACALGCIYGGQRSTLGSWFFSIHRGS